MAEPQNPSKEVNFTYRDQKINLDEYQKAPLPKASEVSIVSRFENYMPVDFSDPTVDMMDIDKLTRKISEVNYRLHGLRNELRIAGRKALSARYAYESEKKRRWIAITGGDARSREAIAEIMTEAMYGEVLVTEQVVKELQQHSRDVRAELDGLTVQSNNIRRQLDVR